MIYSQRFVRGVEVAKARLAARPIDTRRNVDCSASVLCKNFHLPHTHLPEGEVFPQTNAADVIHYSPVTSSLLQLLELLLLAMPRKAIE